MKELWDVLDKNRKIVGRTIERGWLKPGDFHLIVNVWIKNKNGYYLISKRTNNKRWPNLWGPTIGSAITNDNSLTTALKEVKEELGIILAPENGVLFKEFIHYVNENKDCGEFIDVWLFTQEIDKSKVCLQENETCDSMWAKKNEISRMMQENTFISEIDLPYFNELN